MALLSFGFCGAVAVAFAVLIILQRSLYLSAICLLGVLLQASALFFLSGAPLLAFLQIMIYAGAVMVLVVVTIMAAPVPVGGRFARLSIPWPVAAAGLLLPAGQIFWALSRGADMTLAGTALPQAQAAIGPILFGPYAVATEAVTLLMFLSALALVKRRAP